MLGCQPFQMRLRGQLPHTSLRSARHLAPLSKTSRSQQRFQQEQYVPDWMSGVLCSCRDFPVRWRGPWMRTWVENQSLPCLHRGIRRDWISRRAAAGDAPRGSLRSDQQPPFSPRVLPSFLVHQASLGCSLQPQPSRRCSQSHWLRPATLLEEKQKPILSWFFLWVLEARYFLSAPELVIFGGDGCVCMQWLFSVSLQIARSHGQAQCLQSKHWSPQRNRVHCPLHHCARLREGLVQGGE